MSRRSLSEKLASLESGKVIYANGGKYQTVNITGTMRSRFGVIGDVAKEYKLPPINIIARNLDDYKNAIYSLDIKQPEKYISAWLDLETRGNVPVFNKKTIVSPRASSPTRYSPPKSTPPKYSPVPTYSPPKYSPGEYKFSESEQKSPRVQRKSVSPEVRAEREFVSETIKREMEKGYSQPASIAIALSEARRKGYDVPSPKSNRY